jgi:nicotinamidase-related amidase
MWDMQKGLAGRALHADRIKANALRLLAAAQAAHIPVFWSRHVLPPPHLISGPFARFLMQKQGVAREDDIKATMRPGMKETEFLDGLRPDEDHIVLDKSQPSLFIDTPFDLRLKTLGLDVIVLAGVATDIGIEFTARHGASLGYYSVVVEDATGSYTDEAHQRSLAFLRSWITPVVTTDAVCDSWCEHSGAT